MQYVKSEDVQVHYEVEGEGSPLILQHGFTDDLIVWKDAGYSVALRPGRRLILRPEALLGVYEGFVTPEKETACWRTT